MPLTSLRSPGTTRKPSKSERERVQEVQNQIKDDVQWRNKWGEASNWDRYEDYYRGHFTGDGIVPTNVFFPRLRETIPQAYFRNPNVVPSNHLPDSKVKSKILQRLDSWIINLINLKWELKMGAQDTFLMGTGFLKIGYDSLYGLNEELLGQTSYDDKGNRLEYQANVLPGHPWALRFHPTNVLLPWGSTRPADLRRVTFRVLRLLEDVKNDPKYRSSVTKKLTHSTVNLLMDDGNDNVQTNEEWIWLYETHDLREGRVMVTAEGLDTEFLRDDDDLLTDIIGGPPVTIMVWNPNGRALWGVPDAKILEPTQLEANTVSTLASKSRKIDLPKFLYDKDFLDEDDLDALISETVGAGVGVDGNPHDIFMELKPTGQGALSMELERLLHWGREQLGSSVTRSGSYTYPTKRVTAAEVGAVTEGSDIREGARRDAVADALVDVIAKVNRLIFHFWDKEMYIYAPDVDPRFDYIVFRGKDLKGTYDYRIDPEEMRPPSTSEKQQQALVLGPELLRASVQLQGLVDPTSVIHQTMQHFQGWDLGALMPNQPPQTTPKGVARLDPSGVLVPMQLAQRGTQANA